MISHRDKGKPSDKIMKYGSFIIPVDNTIIRIDL